LTTARANLTEADLRRLVRGDSVDERALAARKLCSAVERIAVTEADRIAAQNILRVLAEDTALRVRAALVAALKASTLMPRDSAQRLARDIEEIAVPLISVSPVFTDEDLIEILGFGSAEKQAAVAARPRLSARAAGVICEAGAERAVAAACANDNADIAEPALAQALQRFPKSGSVTVAMARRKDLPLAISEKLIELVEGDLRRQLVERHALKPETARSLAGAAAERVTVDLVDQVFQAADLGAFVVHLNSRGRLTPSLILRALARGQMAFFEHAVSELSGVPHQRTGLMVHDAGPLGLKAIYERAGLPARLFQAFRAGVDAWRSLQQEGAAMTPARFQERMIERFLTHQPYAARDDLDYLLEKLDRTREDLQPPTHANAA
jgi:uncharacterized protein (DUF2336 family)